MLRRGRPRPCDPQVSLRNVTEVSLVHVMHRCLYAMWCIGACGPCMYTGVGVSCPCDTLVSLLHVVASAHVIAAVDDVKTSL